MTEEFTVKFSRIPRTLEYQDAHGSIRFGFDDSGKGPKWLTLEHSAPRTSRGSRYDVAFERTKRYLESCGYQVDIYGE